MPNSPSDWQFSDTSQLHRGLTEMLLAKEKKRKRKGKKFNEVQKSDTLRGGSDGGLLWGFLEWTKFQRFESKSPIQTNPCCSRVSLDITIALQKMFLYQQLDLTALSQALTWYHNPIEIYPSKVSVPLLTFQTKHCDEWVRPAKLFLEESKSQRSSLIQVRSASSFDNHVPFSLPTLTSSHGNNLSVDIARLTPKVC